MLHSAKYSSKLDALLSFAIPLLAQKIRNIKEKRNNDMSIKKIASFRKITYENPWRYRDKRVTLQPCDNYVALF